ncbi:MAG TPA: glycogen synthase [Candidatus Portnoybacteria bacterium]|nr:glycogen synthase [Candidatus Portnoybacteria bacterium]
MSNQTQKIKITFIAAECAPLAKVGGLADVIGSLPSALSQDKLDISIIIPAYETILKNWSNQFTNYQKEIQVKFDHSIKSVTIHQIIINSIPIYLIENKKYLSTGLIYPKSDASSGGSEEEAKRFLFFSQAALTFAQESNPQIIHCHDWHTGIIPHLIKYQNLPFKSILTIHNLAYQGIYSGQLVNQLLATNFPTKTVNCLRQGIINADYVTTVSPNYAQEILTPEFGCGLSPALKKKKNHLIGILNGLDLKIYNPANDPLITTNYSTNNLSKKIKNKFFLQKKFHLQEDSQIPLLSIVCRLTPQKGITLLREIIPRLMEMDTQLILLGSGLSTYEKFLKSFNRKYPQKFHAEIGFNGQLAHQVYAGSDIFLMPSKFEPCGLGQMIAMRYGTIPVAHAVGGLKDTIQNKKNGFLFENYQSEDFYQIIKKTLVFYRQPSKWLKLQKSAMTTDFSWQKSAQEYLKLYQKIS